MLEVAIAAGTKPVPFTRGVVHRACKGCGAANPQGLSSCPKCSKDMPKGEEFDADAQFGWGLFFPAMLIKIGDFLRYLARKIEP